MATILLSFSRRPITAVLGTAEWAAPPVAMQQQCHPLYSKQCLSVCLSYAVCLKLYTEFKSVNPLQ